MMPCSADVTVRTAAGLDATSTHTLNQGSSSACAELRVGRRLLDSRPGRAQVGVLAIASFTSAVSCASLNVASQ